MTERAPVVGWYADPSHRHQHRFWDGQAWTSRVADHGVEADDPPIALPAGPRARARTHARRRAATPTPRNRLPRWPVVVGAVILVGVAIGIAAFVATRHGTKHAAPSTTTAAPTSTTTPRLTGEVTARGAGRFSVAVGKGEPSVRVVHLKAGQTAVIGWRVRSGQATVRAGVSATTVDRLADHGFVTDVQRTAALHEAESLLQVLPKQAATNDALSEHDPTVQLPGFHGVVLAAPDTIVAPVAGDYAVIVAGQSARTRLDFTIAVRGEPSVKGDLAAAGYNDLIASPFHDAVNEFVTAFCTANPDRDRGACDRLQNQNDDWPVTGADPAPEPSAGVSSDSSLFSDSTSTRGGSSTSTSASSTDTAGSSDTAP